MHQRLDAGRAGRLGNGAGAEDVDRVEALAAGIAEDGDEVDHGIGADDGAVDRPAIAQVGLHRLNPADLAERLQVTGEIGAANRGAHAPAALEKRPHDVAAEKPGAAEDGDQSALGDGDRHDASAIVSARSGRPPSHIGCRRSRPDGRARLTDRKRMPDGSVTGPLRRSIRG